MSVQGGEVEEMYHRKRRLETILVAPCFKIQLSYFTFLLLGLLGFMVWFFTGSYLGILDLFILCYKATVN